MEKRIGNYCTLVQSTEVQATVLYFTEIEGDILKKYLMGKSVPFWAFLYFKTSQDLLTFLTFAVAEAKDENIPSLSQWIIYSER